MRETTLAGFVFSIPAPDGGTSSHPPLPYYESASPEVRQKRSLPFPRTRRAGRRSTIMSIDPNRIQVTAHFGSTFVSRMTDAGTPEQIRAAADAIRSEAFEQGADSVVYQPLCETGERYTYQHEMTPHGEPESFTRKECSECGAPAHMGRR